MHITQNQTYLNGRAITHVLITFVSGGRFVFILLRNSVGQYVVEATVRGSNTFATVSAIARTLVPDETIPIVDLGILEKGEFISENVDSLFEKERSLILQACAARS